MINLLDYPRPPNDNGRGVHWVPTPITHWDERWDWERWKTLLLETNIKWVKVLEDGSGSRSNLELIKRLIGLGIMPVVRFYIAEAYPYTVPVGAINYAKELTKYGATYFEFGNEPDLFHLEWGEPAPPYPEWEHLVVERFIAAWDAMDVYNTGAVLLYDAYGPGGQGSGNPFNYFVELGRTDVFQRMGIAVHNYCLGRPLEYPDDPITQEGKTWTQEQYDEIALYENWGSALDKSPQEFIWEASLEFVNSEIERSMRPGETIMENSTGFRAFEYLRNLFVEAAGFEVPIMMTEGGFNPLQVAPLDARYPKPGDKRHRDLTIQMLDHYDYPPYYFGNAGLWFIGADVFGNSADAYEHQGPLLTHTLDDLFNLNGELSVVEYMRNNPGRLLADGPLPEGWNTLQPNDTLSGIIISDTVSLVEPQVRVKPTELDMAWRVYSISHKENTAGYVYFSCIDEEGNPLEGVDAELSDPYGNVYFAKTKGEADDYWGNFTQGGYSGGTLTLKVGDNNSEVVSNLGNVRVDNTLGSTDYYVTFKYGPPKDIVDPPIEPPPVDPPVDLITGFVIYLDDEVVAVFPSDDSEIPVSPDVKLVWVNNNESKIVWNGRKGT